MLKSILHGKRCAVRGHHRQVWHVRLSSRLDAASSDSSVINHFRQRQDVAEGCVLLSTLPPRVSVLHDFGSESLPVFLL